MGLVNHEDSLRVPEVIDVNKSHIIFGNLPHVRRLKAGQFVVFGKLSAVCREDYIALVNISCLAVEVEIPEVYIHVGYLVGIEAEFLVEVGAEAEKSNELVIARIRNTFAGRYRRYHLDAFFAVVEVYYFSFRGSSCVLVQLLV